jgi:hypothetical protein
MISGLKYNEKRNNIEIILKYIMNKLYISIFESLYLVYMFMFFKTNIDFSWVNYNWDNKFLKHLTGNEYGLRICPFGRISIIFLIVLLMVRNIIKINPKYILYAIYLALLISFILNWNSFVYILPVYFIENYPTHLKQFYKS